MTKSKSPLAKLKEIDRQMLEIQERLAPLEAEDAPHVRRTEPLPRGTRTTVLTSNCEPSCPTCLQIQKLYKRYSDLQLGDRQREALIEIAQSRLRSDAALECARSKITKRSYVKQAAQCRTRKEQASLLDVTRQGLEKWEKRNHLKWDKKNGLRKT